MNKLIVKTPSSEYAVIIDPGLLSSVPHRLAALFPKSRFAVITDETVHGLYGPALQAAFADNGLNCHVFAVPPGESSKSVAMFGQLLSQLAQQQYNRADVIVALGGGVVGDLAGFVAASYLRGVRCAQIPTTLLAQIDSSVGGKTGVNLPEGKNLAGAFHQPAAVYIDPALLSTLPAADFADGMAELIKYALIRDPVMFALLENEPPLSARSPMLEDLIVRCVSIKRDVVMADEKDTGERMLLNFGHTIGHGVERICARQGLPMTHGKAVAMGMAAMAAAGERHGLTKPGTASRIEAVLQKSGLPCGLDGFDRRDILDGVLVDKKNLADSLTLVMVSEPGQSFLHRIPRGDMSDYL
jgi:3-dehydroquinate synthase